MYTTTCTRRTPIRDALPSLSVECRFHQRPLCCHSWWSPPLQQTTCVQDGLTGCSGQWNSQVALQTSLLNDTITHSIPSWTAPEDPQPARSRQNSVQPFKSAPSILPAQRRVPQLSAQHTEVASPLPLQSPFALLLPAPLPLPGLCVSQQLTCPSTQPWQVSLPGTSPCRSPKDLT